MTTCNVFGGKGQGGARWRIPAPLTWDDGEEETITSKLPASSTTSPCRILWYAPPHLLMTSDGLWRFRQFSVNQSRPSLSGSGPHRKKTRPSMALPFPPYTLHHYVYFKPHCFGWPCGTRQAPEGSSPRVASPSLYIHVLLPRRLQRLLDFHIDRSRSAPTAFPAFRRIPASHRYPLRFGMPFSCLPLGSSSSPTDPRCAPPKDRRSPYCTVK